MRDSAQGPACASTIGHRVAGRGALALRLSDLYPWKLGTLLRRYVKAHHVSRAALISAGTAAAILFFVIGAAIRLLIGPVSLGPLGGTLADALARASARDHRQIRPSRSRMGARQRGRVNLVILGTRVFDAEGRDHRPGPKADSRSCGQAVSAGQGGRQTHRVGRCAAHACAHPGRRLAVGRGKGQAGTRYLEPHLRCARRNDWQRYVAGELCDPQCEAGLLSTKRRACSSSHRKPISV